MASVGAEAIRHTIAREMSAEVAIPLPRMLDEVTVAWPETKLEVGDITWYRLTIQGQPWWATVGLAHGPVETTLAETVEEALERSDARYAEAI